MQNHFKEPALWINRQADYENMLADLSVQAHIALDTESNSLYAYQEQVCLIQISTLTTDYLVDPLADLDLNGLGEITANEGIEKIFHAAEYDVICLHRDFGFEFSRLFDTMHTARILGFEIIGLSDMLKNQFGIEQGKSFQKADWGKRPLKEEMKTYARYDTHFLVPLRNRLSQMLADKALIPLAEEDFSLLCQSHAEDNHRPLFAQVSGYHKLDGQALRVLDALCRWRDETARELDRPLFKVAGANTLLEAAKNQPASLEELHEIKGISSKVSQRHGEGMLAAIRSGLREPPLELEKRSRPPYAYMKRLDALRDWRKNTALELKVQSDIILPRTIMEKIAGKASVRLDVLREEMEEVPWRFEQFGAQIMKVLEKGS